MKIFTLLVLLTSLIVCTSSSANNDNQNAHENRLYSGRCFHGKRYPSESDLQAISLRDLVDLRPGRRQGVEAAHFAELFAKHPRIRKIDPDQLDRQALIDSWAKIWVEQSPGPHAKKLPLTIADHLNGDERLPRELIDDILKKCRRNKDRVAQASMREKLRTSEDPTVVARRRQHLARLKVYNARRRRGNEQYENQNAMNFNQLLNFHGIPPDLPAEELEVQSRVFREALNGAQKTSVALKHFLKLRNAKEEGITTALRARKDFNYRTLRTRMNSILKEARMAQRQTFLADKQRLESYRENADTMSLQCQSSEVLQDLMRRTKWWKL